MKTFILFFTVLLATSSLKAQKFNTQINKDSLVNVITKDFSKERKEEFLANYNSGNEASKEFLLFMFSMPKSSKKELVENFDSNYSNIILLKDEYVKLLPENYIVSIEFEPENIIVNAKASVTFKIFEKQKSMNRKLIFQEWNLEYNSTKFNQALTILKWSEITLNKVKSLLDKANCVSIENGEITTIGFKRSGMGFYLYNIFSKNLNSKQIKEYDDGCTYIYHKDNIVLEFGSGAVGQECFEKE